MSAREEIKAALIVHAQISDRAAEALLAEVENGKLREGVNEALEQCAVARDLMEPGSSHWRAIDIAVRRVRDLLAMVPS